MLYGDKMKKGQMHELSGLDVTKAQIRQWNRVRNNKKLKSRVRKGIPQALRGTVWQSLCGARERKLQVCRKVKNEHFYQKLANDPKSPFHDQIWKDINRTYRDHIRFGATGLARMKNASGESEPKLKLKRSSQNELFNEKIQDSSLIASHIDLEKHATDGQKQLYRVLKAFSLYREDIGYCQGMQAITALLLQFLPEEDAFWVLASLADDTRYQMELLWRPDMPAIHLRFFQMEKCVRYFLPDLAKHFEKWDVVSASAYQASQWFITIFVSTKMPFECVLRIMDIFVSEGLKTIFRMGLGFLKYYRKQLLKCNMEQMMEIFQEGTKTLKTEDYIETCFTIKITHGLLANFERQYYKLQSK